MERDLNKLVTYDESSEEWSQCDVADSQESLSDFAFSNKKIDLKRNKAKERKRKRRNQRFNHSSWSLKENLLYMKFLKDNGALFDSDKKQRRKNKINVKISRAVKTRSSDQCRSHHQKMMKYHVTLQDIIKFIARLQESQLAQKNNTSKPQRKEIVEVNEPRDYSMGQGVPAYEDDFKIDQYFASNVWWDGNSI